MYIQAEKAERGDKMPTVSSKVGEIELVKSYVCTNACRQNTAERRGCNYSTILT